MNGNKTYNKIMNIHHLLANPEDGTLDFFVKYLRHILISHTDPVLREKFRRFSEVSGEKQIGKDFVLRMSHDIKGRRQEKKNNK